MSTQIGIKYVGTKDRPQVDNLYGTGLVWADTEQVHYVPADVAAKLLKHPDVWAQTDSKEVADDLSDLGIVPPPKKEVEDELVPLVPLDQMDRAGLIVFAKTNFGETLHVNMKEENMRIKIQNWMNSPMAGGR